MGAGPRAERASGGPFQWAAASPSETQRRDPWGGAGLRPQTQRLRGRSRGWVRPRAAPSPGSAGASGSAWGGRALASQSVWRGGRGYLVFWSSSRSQVGSVWPIL